MRVPCCALQLLQFLHDGVRLLLKLPELVLVRVVHIVL